MVNAQLVPIRTFAKYGDDAEEYFNPLDDGIDCPTVSRVYEKTVDAKILYLVVQSSEQLLENGFLPISFVKYDFQRLAMWKMYKKLVASGLQVMGMNTDCFYLERNLKKIASFVQKNPELMASSDGFESIGKWKVGHDKRCRPNLLEQRDNALVVDDLGLLPCRTYDVKGEERWNKTGTFVKRAMKELNKGNTLILADYPGCGKTYLIESFTKDKKHIIVVPHNNLKEDLKKKGKKAMTVHKLLGLGVDERHEAKPFNVDDIEVIAWDELLLNSRRVLWKIYEFMKAHPQIHYLASTDPYQLRAVEDSIHQVRSNTECLDFLFQNKMHLHVVKRVEDVDDIKAYPVIKKALFEEKMTPMDVLTEYSEYFGKVLTRRSDVPAKYNISAFNDTRHAVNDHVHHNILKKKGIVKGDNVVCKGYVKVDCKQRTRAGIKIIPHTPMTRNRIYAVRSIFDDSVELQDPYKKTRRYVVKRKVFDECFDLPYCMTNHAVMGTTIEEPITIYDLDKVNARWFWTAITRATSLNNVNFYMGPPFSCDDAEILMRMKVQHYRRYDMSRGILDEKNLVTPLWIYGELKRLQWMCVECSVPLTSAKGKYQWSVDRLDNDLGHTKQNCRITCLHCNNAKH